MFTMIKPQLFEFMDLKIKMATWNKGIDKMLSKSITLRDRLTPSASERRNSTICYRKKQIDVSFYASEFRHNIVKVSADPLG